MFYMASPTIATSLPPDAAVRTLLTELGLSHLIGIFAEHEVDDAAFLQLNDADLREISIARVPRRKILAAIQTIKDRERQWAPSVVTPPRSPPRPVEAVDAECSICMDVSVEVRVVGCGHTMCSSCAAGWFARTPAGQVTECPTCRGPCTDFEPLVPPALEPATTRPSPVPIVQSAVEPTTRIFVGRAYDMSTPQLIELYKEFGRVVDAYIMLDSAGRSKGCGMVEFSEPEAAARAIEIWSQKRHPRWSKMIVERARPRPGAGAGPETRAVVAGMRPRAASVERADAASEALVRAEAAEARAVAAETRARAASVELTEFTGVASEALVCAEAAEARAVAAEARVALTEARARAAEAREVTANKRAHAAEARVASTETRAVAAETQTRAAEAARSRACATASAFRVENTGLLAKLDASEAAAAAAAARTAETEWARERLESMLKALQGTILDPTCIPPFAGTTYVPCAVQAPPMVLGPLPGSLLPQYPPSPDTIYQGTVTNFGHFKSSTSHSYGFIRIDHSQNEVWVREQDAPDGYLSAGDRCEFRIVDDCSKNKQTGARQWKAVDVKCVQRAAAVPVPPQQSC